MAGKTIRSTLLIFVEGGDVKLTSSYSFLDPNNWSNAQRGQFSSLPDLLQELRAILTWKEQKLFKRAKM